MPGIYEIAIAEAYELKAGGFRGVAKNKDTGEVRRGEPRETLAQARHDAQTFVAAMLGDKPLRPAPIYKKANWRCHYWADA